MARSGAKDAAEFEEMILRELCDYKGMCHCPLETPCITTRSVKERGTFVYKYSCSRCAYDATVRTTADMQGKEACKHPPKNRPGWENTYYRASKDPKEPEYPLPKDPHLQNGLFRVDGKKFLPSTPFKDLHGTVRADGGPIMTTRCVTTGARFAPYVARPGHGGPGGDDKAGASPAEARRVRRLPKMSP